jgi:hypothetical protein
MFHFSDEKPYFSAMHQLFNWSLGERTISDSVQDLSVIDSSIFKKPKIQKVITKMSEDFFIFTHASGVDFLI